MDSSVIIISVIIFVVCTLIGIHLAKKGDVGYDEIH